MRALSIAAFLLLPACVAGSGADGSGTEASGTTTYVNIMDFPGVDQGQWYDTARKLNDEFTAVCGDTFCEGDYANLTPLTFACSVSSKLGSVKDCAWTFAASDRGVDSTTAAVSIDSPTFVCHVHPRTTATALIALLSGSSDALHATLPGTTGSIYDALGDCFTHPIGATPITATYTTPPTYVEASDYYTTATNQAKWQAAKAALKLGFDNVCGDTFCGSDFSDLQSMDVVCAITRSSGNVKSCQWVFAGSFNTVNKVGAVVETSKSWRCPIAMHGTLSQLITVLTANDPINDAIHRPLPGTTAVAYDSIAGCLP